MTMKRIATARIQAIVAHALIVAAVLSGCVGQDSKCDPGQDLSNGVCFTPDAPASTVDADLRFAHFGDVCADETACVAPTTFCVILPGEATGYCTATGCLEDATVCPVDWGCVDLSVYGPGLPSICGMP